MITIHDDRISLTADENDGLTVVSLRYNGIETIEADEERIRKGVTYGIPILFPTPNRISGGRYTFNGRTIEGEMHGTLRHARFGIISHADDSIEAEIPFSALGSLFPYDGHFHLHLHLLGGAVIWDFSIRNEGEEPLAFGLALHPFFCKQEGMRFSSTLEYEMEASEEKLPSGRWTRTDYGREKDVSGMDIDTVFFSDSTIRSSLVSEAYSIEITGSDDFDHVVVFTSPDRSFICVEPQTCSTDAHNMYAKGLKKESGLIIVPGESRHELSVRMAFCG